MDRIKEVLTFLRGNKDYVSGDYISTDIGISRTAVWKYMNQLERMGYRISKLKGKGYKLVQTPDRVYPWEIERFLTSGAIGRRIIYRDSVDSTNVLAYRLALGGEPEGTCVITEAQEKGKGRLGRIWFSPAGKNIYLSAVLRPSIHPSAVYPITFISSLAVSDTVESLTGLKTTLKWPNDVLLNGRKICGSLLELSTEADAVRFVVVGIGLNVNMIEADINKELRPKATSMYLETKKIFERPAVCGMLLSNLEKYYRYFMDRGEEETCAVWEKRAMIKGKFLEVSQVGEIHKGICEGVSKEGAILLNIDGTVTRIMAGDVNF